MTSLFLAVSQHNLEKVEALIKGGANVNERNENEDTALMIAIEKGFKNVIKLLIELGADVNIQNKWKKTPLITLLDSRIQKLSAVKHEHLSLGDFFSFNVYDIVKLLIDAGADVNIRDDWHTALFEAIANNHSSDIIKLLIDANADVNSKSNSNSTILMELAIEVSYTFDFDKMSNLLNSAYLLIEAGADIDAKNDDGQTALSLVISETEDMPMETIERYEEIVYHLQYHL